MTIEITVSQRCTNTLDGPTSYYFAKDTTATFTLDGNSDNAQMMAGYALGGIIKAHRGDVLLVEIRFYDALVGRWVGEADTIAADELEAFVNGRMSDFAHTVHWINGKRANLIKEA